jgi:transposase
MRGRVDQQADMFHVFDIEDLVPGDHPLRKIKPMVDAEIARLRPLFNKAYSNIGRPSVPPEFLIKASLLQAFYSIRSERQLCEQIAYNFLYRWFLDLKLDGAVWNHSTFTKNRERFAEHGLMRRFFDGSVARAINEEAVSEEHFSVDGTLIEAWASMKSVRRKDESDDDSDGDSNGWKSFKGEKRSNTTHASTSDPESRLARKGKGRESRLSHSMHALMENRNGLLLDIVVDEANGRIERDAALAMLDRVGRRHHLRPETLGADKGYDDGPFLESLECERLITPHVSIRDGVIRARDVAGQCRLEARRRQATKGYRASQIVRKRIEEIFGWLKTVGGLDRTRFIGRWKTQSYAYSAGAAWNFMRRANLSVS